ncbi:MAG TPA: hypothetical protein VE998_11180 [Terriglobales bacterium]|nr:hypothetical protein [Terriglobales bacterium]
MLFFIQAVVISSIASEQARRLVAAESVLIGDGSGLVCFSEAACII